MTLLELQNKLGEQIELISDKSLPMSTRKSLAETAMTISSLAKQMINNACSMLYGACARIAKDMGYRKVITYILLSENGASLKASNFVCEGEAGGEMWTGKRSGRDNGVPKERKTRWSKTFSEVIN